MAATKAGDAYAVAKDKAIDALDTAKAVASVVAEKAADAYEKAKDKAQDLADKVTADETVAETAADEPPAPVKEPKVKPTPPEEAPAANEPVAEVTNPPMNR